MFMRQMGTVANQITLLRLVFVPFIIINVVDGSIPGRWLSLSPPASATDSMASSPAASSNKRFSANISTPLPTSSAQHLFLVLSFMHRIPWRFTVLVFTRDIGILLVSAILYAAVGLRNFRPSIYGKLNTASQIGAIFFVLLFEIDTTGWLLYAKRGFLWLTFLFTLLSGIHYIYLVEQRLRTHTNARSATR